MLGHTSYQVPHPALEKAKINVGVCRQYRTCCRLTMSTLLPAYNIGTRLENATLDTLEETRVSICNLVLLRVHVA